MLVALLSVRLADESAGFLIPGSFEAIRSELHLSYAQAATILAAGAPGAIVGNGFSIAADYASRRIIAAGGALWFAELSRCSRPPPRTLLVAAVRHRCRRVGDGRRL